MLLSNLPALGESKKDNLHEFFFQEVWYLTLDMQEEFESVYYFCELNMNFEFLLWLWE